MSLKKQYLKTKPVCKVTFRLPAEAAENANSVSLVGDFYDWDPSKTPMKKLKNGSYKAVLDLDPDQNYEFRYLINGDEWENDWEADDYVGNPYGAGENSVVSV
ncbi:MAG: isoamylase early set domain-containing protein [Candidatus Marinimicrobia bacterium]|nr:isoamylase early set domain-containing protein [Candidatus Neomarinimicrobiota bacterium]MCF7829266.1 isoamylase early set domain-containing protein [Candidatus Neomarinimicrobiota bacterium]MCF7881081.1 isoamylase early set domain-containing protein [Candidatus Neomarinimicrobiota bacterium]